MRVVLSLPDRDAVIRCTADDPAGAAAEPALGHPLGRAGLFVRGRPVDPRTPASALLDGTVVSEGHRDASETNPPTGTLLAHVICGPGAGTVVALPAGRTTIGRVPPFSLADHDVSREHVHLDVDAAGGVTATDAGSTNGSSIDGAELTAPTALRPDQVLWAGNSAVTVRPVPTADAAVRPDGEGGLLYNRPPRLEPPRRVRRVTVPTVPKAPEKRDWPVVMVVAPLVIGVVMAMVRRPPGAAP